MSRIDKSPVFCCKKSDNPRGTFACIRFHHCWLLIISDGTGMPNWPLKLYFPYIITLFYWRHQNTSCWRITLPRKYKMKRLQILHNQKLLYQTSTTTAPYLFSNNGNEIRCAEKEIYRNSNEWSVIKKIYDTIRFSVCLSVCLLCAWAVSKQETLDFPRASYGGRSFASPALRIGTHFLLTS